jgi:choline dehydrogenase
VALAPEPSAQEQFSAGRPGPLNSVLCDVGAFFSTIADPVVPNMEIHAAPTAFADGLALDTVVCRDGLATQPGQQGLRAP